MTGGNGGIGRGIALGLAEAGAAVAVLGRNDEKNQRVLSEGVLHERPEDWDSVIETQLNTVFLLSKLAARSMLSRKCGKIINLGSMNSFFGSGLIPLTAPRKEPSSN